MKIAGNTLNEGIENFLLLKKYQPFKFSGTFYLGMIKDQIFALRTKKASKAGMHSLSIATLS